MNKLPVYGRNIIYVRSHPCSPICEGEITVYNGPDPGKIFYVCSISQKKCPLLSLRIEIDGIGRKLNDADFDVSVLTPGELAAYGQKP